MSIHRVTAYVKENGNINALFKDVSWYNFCGSTGCEFELKFKK